jgi:hypothetical protein
MTGPGVRERVQEHRSVVAWLMILALAAGLYAFLRLGRSGEPPLAHRRGYADPPREVCHAAKADPTPALRRAHR